MFYSLAVVERPVLLALVDPGCTGEEPAPAAAQEGFPSEIIKHHDARRGFALLPLRRVVE